jgi:hypothetical protein
VYRVIALIVISSALSVDETDEIVRFRLSRPHQEFTPFSR